jgi:hypothetical protein
VHLQDDSDSGYLSNMLRRGSRGMAKVVTYGAHDWKSRYRHTKSFGDVSMMFSFLQSRLDAEVPGAAGQQEQHEQDEL